MVLETQPLSLSQWLSGAGPIWLLTMGGLGLLVLLLGFARHAFMHGVGRGGELYVGSVLSTLADVLRISPRRVFALAWLAVQESIRRKALAGFVVFVVMLLFALWFLDTSSVDPATLYTDFVLTGTMYLVLGMALFISVFSLPNDLKSKTIYTIVTKPVRPSEVVLGRILGFSFIGTVLLAAMGLCSYVFVIRSLDHTHEVTPAAISAIETMSQGDPSAGQAATTSTVRHHRHQLVVRPDGSMSTDLSQGHWHEVTKETHGGKTRYFVGPPRDQFHARVPIYGKLRFKNRSGAESAQGLKVGNEWTYRSYMEGDGLATANWTFQGVRAKDFPDGVRVDMTISIFRTHKGDIEKGVLGSLCLRNPRTKVSSNPQTFFAKEYTIDRHFFPRKLADAGGKPLDLFEDLVSDGELEVELACLQKGQFFGMAQPDVYLLAREGSIAGNFIKGYLGIWLQMVLVVTFGVMWSTFLNGAVAMLATFGTLVAGFIAPFIRDLAENKVQGGGSIEALVRIVQHKSATARLDDTIAMHAVGWFDSGVRQVLYAVSVVLPDFGKFSSINYVAAGFDIPRDVLLIQMLTALGYLVPVFLLGFVFFKAREVAR